MICQGCFRASARPLCKACFADLRPAPDRLLGGRVRAIAAFDHTGVAASLMHGMKYRGLRTILDLAIPLVAARLEPGLTFVSVPRVWSRYLRYGIDPAEETARSLAAATSGRVARLIKRPIHASRRAGAERRPGPGRFHARSGLQGSYVIVDDVLTTGATVIAAMQALLPGRTAMVVTVTSARQVSSLFMRGAGGHNEHSRSDLSGDGG
ncbi:MAG: ComF family protein [Actinobacteria bacterium]|nr:MAG: ComF family protein [Actinomycetota bacterium]REK35136.1 MAG: ComF family protein [Actinomycetota bacterium]